MPIFEYECTKCGHRTEHLQLSSGAPLTACPECNGKVRKLMSAPAFQFKGTGWYVTDYAGKDKDKSKARARGSEGSDGDGAKGNKAASSEGGESKKSKGADDSSSAKTSTPKSSAKTASPSD